MALTVPALIAARAVSQSETTILRKKDRGIWQAITWGDLGARQRRIGLALLASAERGDVVGILADAGPDWIAADLAILGAGMISLGLYPTDGADRLAGLLRATDCRVLFVEGEEQLDKALQARATCPGLARIVIFDMKGLRDFVDPGCESLDAFCTRALSDNAAWTQSIAAIAPADIAVIAVTSGTSGAPKLVTLSHANLTAQMEAAAALTGQGPADERLAFLPMGIATERVFGLYLALHTGTVSNLVESAETVPENLREVRPTVMFAIPRIWEKLHSQVSVAVAAATPLQRFLYRRALGLNASGGPLAWLAAQAVLRPVRRALGLDRLRLAWVGAAPVSPELILWYKALGIDMRAVYGLAEAAGLAAAMPAGANRPGAVGKPLPHGEIMLSDTGEIMLRGPHVSPCYWNEAPRGAGWLHTGDLGRMDDGLLHLTGRASERMTTGGVAIMPAAIENDLKLSPFIADAVVTGDGQDFLSCLVMIEHETVERWAQAQNVPFTSFASLARNEKVRDLIGAEIARIQHTPPIRAFRLIGQRIEPEDPEVTPVMKLRRAFVIAKYQDLLDEMYRAA